MQVVPTIAVKLVAACEVSLRLIPAPEPGIVFFVPHRLFAAILRPFDFRRRAENAGVFRADAEGASGHERADVNAHAIVDVRFPTYRLFMQRLPAYEHVVWRLAFKDLD